MRLLHVISSLNPESGGTVEGLRQIVTALVQQGHEVEVATLDDPAAEWANPSDILVHAMGPGKFNYRYSRRFIPWLKENACRFDAVIIEGIWQFHSLGVWLALRGSRIPYFVFTHGMLSPWFKKAYPLKHIKKWLYWPWADYWVLRNAKEVFFTCEEERRLARQSFWLYQCQERVVGYGTVDPVGDAHGCRQEFLAHYPGLVGKRLLLFMGRLHPVKGCDILLEAFSRVADRDASLHLVMAGPDSQGWKNELTALCNKYRIADRVTWTGGVTGNMKWGAFAATEAFILPSHQENFGMVVAEALACGKPVLISDKVNIWREVEASGAAIVGNDTVSGVVGMLHHWLDMDEKARLSMSGKARSCFETQFEVGPISRRLVQVIQGDADD